MDDESIVESEWLAATTAFGHDPERAKWHCERVLSVMPTFWGAHWMLSRTYQAEGRFRLSVAHARASVRHLRNGSSPHEILLVSSGLISVGEYEACALLLSELKPSISMSGQQFSGLIEQWMMLDEPATALQWLDVADAAGVKGGHLRRLRGDAQRFLGNFGDAAAAYESAIGADPANAQAHYALAALSISEGRAGRITRLKRLVDRNERPNAVGLLYALFKELDEAGETEDAWRYLEKGMRMRKAASGHDRSVEDAIFQTVIDNMGKHKVAATNDGRAPIFIIGLPRSGTTVVERILGNHPEVASCGELSNLRMAYKWASDYYCSGLLDEASARLLGRVDRQAFGDLYLQSTRRKSGGRRWHTDKHPGNLVLAGLALDSLPNAKVINVHRNPVDNCFACLRELFAPSYYEYSYDFDDVANHYGNYRLLMRQLSMIHPDRVIDVSYETLVANPAAAASRLLEGCGLPPASGAEDITANQRPVTTASSVQVRAPIHSGRVGYWMRYERQLAPLRAALDRRGIR